MKLAKHDFYHIFYDYKIVQPGSWTKLVKSNIENLNEKQHRKQKLTFPTAKACTLSPQ